MGGAGQGGGAAGRGGEGGAGRAPPWVPSRQRSAAAGSPPRPGSRGRTAALGLRRGAGRGGGATAKVKSLRPRPGLGRRHAGCFDHGGAVAVSFCSRGLLEGRRPPALGPCPSAATRPPPTPAAAPGREDALGLTACRPFPDVPLLPPRSPSGRAAGRGRRPAPAAALPRRGPSWARCQGVLGTRGSAPASALRSPPRPAPRPSRSPPHACTLLAGGDAALRRAGGCAKRRARTTAPACAPAAAATPAHTRHTRAHCIHTYARPPNTQLSTCAHTHARTQARRARIPTSCTRFLPRNRWPWNLVTSAATPFSWVR